MTRIIPPYPSNSHPATQHRHSVHALHLGRTRPRTSPTPGVNRLIWFCCEWLREFVWTVDTFITYVDMVSCLVLVSSARSMWTYAIQMRYTNAIIIISSNISIISVISSLASLFENKDWHGLYCEPTWKPSRCLTSLSSKVTCIINVLKCD